MTKINNLAKHDTLKLVLIPYLLNFWSFWIVFYMDIDCKHWYNPLVFVVFWSISLFPHVFSLWQLFELDLKMKKKYMIHIFSSGCEPMVFAHFSCYCFDALSMEGRFKLKAFHKIKSLCYLWKAKQFFKLGNLKVILFNILSVMTEIMEYVKWHLYYLIYECNVI